MYSRKNGKLTALGGNQNESIESNLRPERIQQMTKADPTDYLLTYSTALQSKKAYPNQIPFRKTWIWDEIDFIIYDYFMLGRLPNYSKSTLDFKTFMCLFQNQLLLN